MRLLFLFITIAAITAWLFSKKLKLFNESFFNFIMFLVLGIISIVSYIYSNNDYIKYSRIHFIPSIFNIRFQKKESLILN